MRGGLAVNYARKNKMREREQRTINQIIKDDFQIIAKAVKNFLSPLFSFKFFATVLFAITIAVSIMLPLFVAQYYCSKTGNIIWAFLSLLTLGIGYFWACWFRSEKSERFFKWLEDEA